MLLMGIVCLSLGCLTGKFLINKGITIDFTIENPKHQRNILIALATIPVIVVILLFIDQNNLPNIFALIIPEICLLYLGAYFYDLLIYSFCFMLGLLLFLEFFSKAEKSSKKPLLFALLILTFALSVLVDQTLPIAKYLKQPKIINGYIVLQTTGYTCAPATIATLGRYTKKYPNLTEREVVKLTKTDKIGTSTLKEIQALKTLDFEPEYLKNLEINNLININRPAVLHVKENYNNQIVSHAVAFLQLDKSRKIIVLANPLYGLQVKTFEQMEEYWNGEAIFINKLA